MLPSLKKIFLATLAIPLLVLSYDSYGQLKRFPAYPTHANTSIVENGLSQARTKETAPLTLPFFDDFSRTNGVYADTLLWESSSSVWINDGMAIHPPTINVATFDGLDSAGMPYNSNEILLTGYTDTLMSRPIDLSEPGVPAAERSGVYLSFMYQWQGNIEPPDEDDFLELSFRTAEENGWKIITTIHPSESEDPTVFHHAIVQVAGDEFFHNAFQFRIRAFGRLSGPFDVWHVDYFYLNKGRHADDISFPDRALSTRLGPLFGRYRAIPRDHLVSNEQLTPPAFEIQNMKNQPASINFRTEGYFRSANRKTGTLFPEYETVISKATPINITNNVLLGSEHKSSRLDTLPDIMDPLQFPPDAGIDSTIIELQIALQTRDNVPFNTTPPIEPDSTGDYTKNYLPIRFTSNDTLKARYILSDYFAYDDGVAEFAAGLIEAGNRVAYEFELDTAHGITQDTLIAIDVYFPPYAITSNQTVDFFVYHEDTENAGLPGEQWMRIAARRVERKGLNEFQRIEFLPAILIDEPRFFIGWLEPSAGEVMVGLDISGDTGDKIFVNTNGLWYRNDEVKGNLMLRPVFGSGIIDSSVGIDEEAQPGVYPNPNSGTFFIAGQAQDLRIYSMTGQSIPFESQAGEDRTEVRLMTASPGLYLLQYRQDKALRSKKLIIRAE